MRAELTPAARIEILESALELLEDAFTVAVPCVRGCPCIVHPLRRLVREEKRRARG